MLTATYIHSPGIGQTTERSLWEQGAHSWLACLENFSQLKLSARHRPALQATVEESIAALDSRSVAFFADRIPKKEHWRTVQQFNRIGYLDIETDGGLGPNSVTIIGLFDGFETHSYVKGRNLEQFAVDCREFDAFVTFFGGGFDIPFLKRRFPELDSVFQERLHIDLCPLLKRLGHSGGLKRIEQQLKIYRVPETDGLSGFDAIRLWQAYQRKDRHSSKALDLLLAYNEEDVVNLKTLLEYATPRMQESIGYQTPSDLR
jgi:uncharacterized protein YprB with RNaseH-like and TPR domain